jgi:hypothetical protein
LDRRLWRRRRLLARHLHQRKGERAGQSPAELQETSAGLEARIASLEKPADVRSHPTASTSTPRATTSLRVCVEAA